MWVVYVLLFGIVYFFHCTMARNLLQYYSAQPYPFHWNLFRWNQDVQLLLDRMV